jgi:hypothetical protein
VIDIDEHIAKKDDDENKSNSLFAVDFVKLQVNEIFFQQLGHGVECLYLIII